MFCPLRGPGSIPDCAGAFRDIFACWSHTFGEAIGTAKLSQAYWKDTKQYSPQVRPTISTVMELSILTGSLSDVYLTTLNENFYNCYMDSLCTGVNVDIDRLIYRGCKVCGLTGCYTDRDSFLSLIDIQVSKWASKPSSSLCTGCVVAMRWDWAIFCHAGSVRVVKVWSAREKSFEILRRG